MCRRGDHVILFSFPKWGCWSSEKLRNVSKISQVVGSRFRTPSQIFWLLFQCSPSYIRDVSEAAGGFQWSEWYPSWCSCRIGLTTLSLDSSGLSPSSQGMLMLVGVSLYPLSEVTSPGLALGGVCLRGIYCPVLTRLFHFTLDSHQDPTRPEAPPPPGHLQAPVLKLQSHFPQRVRRFSWDHTLFSHEKCLWKISPSASTINTDAHVSPGSSLPLFAALLRGLGASFPEMWRARPRLEVLDSVGWSLGWNVVFFSIYSFCFYFPLCSKLKMFLPASVSIMPTLPREKWVMPSENPRATVLNTKPRNWSDTALSPPPNGVSTLEDRCWGPLEGFRKRLRVHISFLYSLALGSWRLSPRWFGWEAVGDWIVSPFKFICWSPNPQYLIMWLYWR